MPELKNRDRYEKGLAAGVGRLMRDQKADLLAQLSSRDPAEISDRFWTQQQKASAVAIGLLLLPIHVAASGQMFDGEYADPNRSRKWANRYAQGVAKDLVSNTRSTLVAAGRSGPDSLSDAMKSLYGPGRVENIAITEVTRTATKGQADAVALYQVATGIRLKPYWNAMRDACEECRQYNDTGFEVWGSKYPNGPFDAHPRCRCWIDYREE
jgi:hypothetical protein